MQRVAIVGDGPAALSTAERLIGAGMCVDLVCAKPAPFGLLRRFAGLAGVRHEAAASPCPAPAPFRQRARGRRPRGRHHRPRAQPVGRTR